MLLLPSISLILLLVLRVKSGKIIEEGGGRSSSPLCPLVNEDVSSSSSSSSFSSQAPVHASDCLARGHWPLTRACSSPSSGVFYDPAAAELKAPSDPTRLTSIHDSFFVHDTWNISISENISPVKCAARVPRAVFMPIAFDEVAYQTEASNYYVTHIDMVIPLWNMLSKSKKALGANYSLPEIFLFAFNVQGKVDLMSRAFDDVMKYWIQSLQILVGDTQLQFGTLHSLDRYFNQVLSQVEKSSYELSSTPILQADKGVLCFEEVFWGLPQFNPNKRAIRRFSQDYRNAILQHTANSFPVSEANVMDVTSEKICNNMVKKIGIVVRKGRRKIANVDQFMKSLQFLSEKWCSRVAIDPDSCGVTFEKVMFGRERDDLNGTSTTHSSSVERDIWPLQEYSVIFGIQGSGLINALYMPPVSSAIAVYLNDGWPISSADPLVTLGHRGPYIVHINRDPSKILCHLEKDEFCDSGDLTMDAETYETIFSDALDLHISECQKLKYMNNALLSQQ